MIADKNWDLNQIDSTGKHPSDIELPELAFHQLVENLKKYLPNQDLNVIRKAYEFARDNHEKQRRQSGEPYILHPLAVANILTEIKLDIASIVAAILHDVVEDTNVTLKDIETNFGKVVAELVDGLTKISKIQFRSSQEKLAENFRKMVLAMAKDLRVILIKLADRLHNMRTLEALPPDKRDRIANETLEIYAPLANRLGIYGIKSELEDLCFKQLKNDLFQDIKTKVAAKKAEREKYIDDVKTILENELVKYGFKNVSVYGRPKHFYSIYQKMIERQLSFEDLHDLFAFRIIVDTVKDCYEALGVVHSMWKPMPGRFKDYIAMPKPNLYQSLHTTVVRPRGEPAEIQIRTKEMHEVCEYGIAAHWAYKEKGGTASSSETDLKKFSWLRQIMQWQSELKDPDEFLEAVKVDLFQEELFVFTPRGDVIQLPRGATALDFAFAVHSEVGLSTFGAKVNGRIVPLKKPLVSGDIVEILTSQNRRPSKDWLSIVTTARAKNKIRSYLRSEQRSKSRQMGQSILEQELVPYEINYEKFVRSDEAEAMIKTAKVSNLEDLLTAIGYGKLNLKEILAKLYPQKAHKSLVQQAKDKIFPTTEQKVSTKSKKIASHGILVSGLTDILVNFGRCCSPLPGEEIVGFITRGRGVTIHRTSCSRALDMDPKRKVDVEWTEDSFQGSYSAFITVLAYDKTGVLAEISNAISSCEVNIKKAQIEVAADMTGLLNFELGLRSLKQLQAVVKKLESLPSVVKIERKGIAKT